MRGVCSSRANNKNCSKHARQTDLVASAPQPATLVQRARLRSQSGVWMVVPMLGGGVQELRTTRASATTTLLSKDPWKQLHTLSKGVLCDSSFAIGSSGWHGLQHEQSSKASLSIKVSAIAFFSGVLSPAASLKESVFRTLGSRVTSIACSRLLIVVLAIQTT